MTASSLIGQKPNIVIILADDMGFSDIGCFGSEIRTPNLDELASKGVRFTQMYNAARCCPTRASLLTGQYPHRAGVGLMIDDRGVGPAYQGFLRDDCPTIGEVLQPAGYRTLYVGKWHASPGLPIDRQAEPESPVGSARNPYPLSRGFDRFYGTLAGCGSFFYPHGLMDQERRITADALDYYYTDAMTDKACGMVREAVEDQSPFFLHLCYTAPHWPLHALPEDIASYDGLYDDGWDAVRQARFERLQASGVIDRQWPVSPRDTASRNFAADTPERQHWEALRMQVYAAQVTAMDRAIGRLLNTLEETGVADNTLVIFMSDNGGCAEFLREDGEPDAWPELYAKTARPGTSCTVGNIPGMDPGSASTFMSYDLPWANASNTPFRRYKHWVHEGGIATPCVAYWPGHTPAGAILHRPRHLIDLLPTCLELAGATYPETCGGKQTSSLPGESFCQALQGADGARRNAIFWEHEGNRAVRDGDWKLVSANGGPWELYNMAEDRTELEDRAAVEPERAQELAAQYEAWARDNGVLPWPLKRS